MNSALRRHRFGTDGVVVNPGNTFCIAPAQRGPRRGAEANARGGRAPLISWRSHSIFTLICLAGMIMMSGIANGDEFVRQFVQQHCVKCHGQAKQKGKLRLDTLAHEFTDAKAVSVWVEVRDQLNLGEMPPKDETRPMGEDVSQVTGWIAGELRAMQRRANSTGGRALLRRLNRAEYSNTVRDLLSVVFVPGAGPEDMLPPDGKIAGFDKVSKGLLLDPSLMDAYYRTAEFIANRAVPLRPPTVPSRRIRFEYEDTRSTGAFRYIAERRSTEFDGDFMVIMESDARSFAQLLHPYNNKMIPVRGEYAIRIRAAARPGADGEPVYMSVKRGGDGELGKFKIDATPDSPKIYEIVRAFIPDGGQEIGVSIVNGTRFNDNYRLGITMNEEARKAGQAGDFSTTISLQARGRAEGWSSIGRPNTNTLSTKNLPRLYLDYIEIEGPLQGPWPPVSLGKIFFKGRKPELANESYAREIFEELLPRAYRRPVEPSEVETVMSVVRTDLQRGVQFEEAVKSGLVTMLCSPAFLYVIEPSAPAAPRRLTDYEMASRLSYFLWSSMPDEALMVGARAGRLSTDARVSAMVDAMLENKRSEALVNQFAAQWLKVAEFDRFIPDARLYRDYYANQFAGLGEDLKQEPLAVFRELLRKDLPVTSLLNCDWTMANERLASYYGIKGVIGEEFQRVLFSADSPRGGLLGMAGFHKWGSDGNRTKPVERGKYLLDVLFNDPPDPPPPNAGEVEPNVRGKRLTVRERLIGHQEIEACANCHKRLDPYGLALENFNVVGAWRDVQDGEDEFMWRNNAPAIDASGTLPNGRPFKDIFEFKRALANQDDRFLRGLAEKMFIYALGRTIEPTDEPTLDSLVQEMKKNGKTLRSLINGIVRTDAFRTK